MRSEPRSEIESLLSIPLSSEDDLFGHSSQDRPRVKTENLIVDGKSVPKYSREFWTSRQRQASRIHEISYRACFKPQLPRFFIENFSNAGDLIYDPFGGRGTTAIEAALLRRNIASNDINPLSRI